MPTMASSLNSDMIDLLPFASINIDIGEIDKIRKVSWMLATYSSTSNIQLLHRLVNDTNFLRDHEIHKLSKYRIDSLHSSKRRVIILVPKLVTFSRIEMTISRQRWHEHRCYSLSCFRHQQPRAGVHELLILFQVLLTEWMKLKTRNFPIYS